MSEIHASLTRALGGQWTAPIDLDLDQPHRYAILSDQHKGAGDGADEFRKCRPAYVAALASYLTREFTVVLLGDVEELWENRFQAVERTYQPVLQLEAAFPPERYYRIWGNHDDLWMEPRQVGKKLGPYLPGARVFEGLRIRVHRRGADVGTLFLLHGHQGTFESDRIRPLSRLALRLVYRPIQNLLGIGKQTPANDACLRGEHDKTMYQWAAKQRKLILIAGHTHRPVWAGQTHLQKLEAELQQAMANPRPGDPAYATRVSDLRIQIAYRRALYPPCNDAPQTIPCYFNTGCCKFEDGDITGMELENGRLKLVKWPAGGSAVQAKVLE
ncbi:MAG: metallophosphoesterase family protein, partial [Gemmatimonadetes bacterium]|nr:metallophosphoesterase family protein [Gemmatimonadota bacterium]